MAGRLAIVALSVFALLVSAEARACPRSPSENLDRARDVFRGILSELVETRPAAVPAPMWERLPQDWRPKHACRATFAVTQVIKGDRGSVRSVAFSSSDCSVSPLTGAIGDEFVVFTEREDGETQFLFGGHNLPVRHFAGAYLISQIGPGHSPDPLPAPSGNPFHGVVIAVAAAVASAIALLLLALVSWRVVRPRA